MCRHFRATVSCTMGKEKTELSKRAAYPHHTIIILTILSVYILVKLHTCSQIITHTILWLVAAMRLIVCLQAASLIFDRRVLARSTSDGPAARYNSLNRHKVETSQCDSNKEVGVKAPWKNIFQSLTDQEYADVTAYLHKQEELNLTAIVNSTS